MSPGFRLLWNCLSFMEGWVQCEREDSFRPYGAGFF